MLKIKVGNKSFTLSDIQEKALNYVMVDIYEWTKNCLENRARQAITEIVEEVSDKQEKKISLEEKEQIVREAKIKSAKERQVELEAKIKEEVK